MDKGPEKTFFQREHINVQQVREKESIPIPNHQGNVDQTTLRYHLTPARMALIKKTTNNKWR